MKAYEKAEFLRDAKDLANNLENVTDEFIEIQIGWIKTNLGEMPLTIMVNHPEYWFGGFDKQCWNEFVVNDNYGRFTPVKDPYLVLNELITQAYNGGAK